MQNQTTQDSHKCNICKDFEFVLIPETNKYRACECREKKIYRRILESSGISESFQKIGFKEFTPAKGLIKDAKATAIEYVKKFRDIEGIRENSIAFLGNPGSGKTHLSIAIANNLMADNIGVLYMPYREVVTRIKQNINDDREYAKLTNPYKTARVLLIDDLFKGKITASDINIMFDIINHRYLKNAPIIVSSEFTRQRLLDFDEAIGSRIIQMSKGRILEFAGKEYNYRLKAN